MSPSSMRRESSITMLRFDQREIKTMSAYGQAVKDAKRGRLAGLESFAEVRVKDIFGNEYQLLTDINAYYHREQVYG